MKYLLALTVFAPLLLAQNKLSPIDKFRQLEEVLPTPNEYRTASGAPGHKYWQQRADYNIKVELDDENQRIIGSETINYHNVSPDALNYLWMQLDQNIFEPSSDANVTRTAPDFSKMPFGMAAGYLRDPFDGGDKVTSVRDSQGQPLAHTINKTMMRIDLKKPLASGESVTFSVDWNYKINNSKKVGGRTGYEYFEKDQNYIYEIAQWFPRMAAYYDVYGWQHKQFLGAGEFTLEFGDYKVAITAPSDFVIAGTGVLQNPQQVLTKNQRARLEQAKSAKKPVYIITPDEALTNEKSRAKDKKTWIFHGDNVRDFAFAGSRKFLWDAQGHEVEGNKVMAMSFFPKEGNPLWERYSTAAIIHTLDVYSRYSFTFPYPIAQSINGPIGGMEYPMICFNGPRPLDDKTYSSRTKYGLISVVIHEVGHNFFPMVVNSDERQWTWMDEGINSFLQYLAEQEWEKDYPSRRDPKNITAYMTSNLQEPIMTNSDSILQLGNNAYAKPATALNILRETIMGRELFDFSFKQYSQRWKFKRPTPADFFRTMQDASGVDLNWFWRGWFYSTDHTDISIEDVKLFTIDTRNPDIEKPISRRLHEEEPVTVSSIRNAPLPKAVDAKPELKDFYNTYDEYTITAKDREDYKKFVDSLKPEEKAGLEKGFNFYVITFKNIGGLVMPVILAIDYADGTREEMRIPVEIWRRNNIEVAKLIVTQKEIKQITLDPHLETADTDLSNNYYPRKTIKSPFQLFKDEQEKKNPMQELEHKSTNASANGVQQQ
jgi:hypothetical protein